MPRVPSNLGFEIATLASDPLRWWYGGKIMPEDSVLAARGQGKGLWLYDELTRDPRVGTVLDKRKLALVGRDWSIEPKDESAPAKAAAAFIEDVLDAIDFDSLVKDLLDATLKGIAVAEILWQVAELGIVPRRIVNRDPRRFFFREVEGQDPELRLLTKAQPLDGIALPARKFLLHRFGGRYGNPWGLGLGQRLFWPVFFKRQGVGFWLQAVEKFAAPTPLGKYPPNTSEADQDKLLDALTAIAREAAVIVPEGMIVELIEAKRAGAFDTYEKLSRYFDEDITIAVLGGSLTTAVGDSGSRALGDVHETAELSLVRGDASLLSGTLNTSLIPWLIELNMPGSPVPRIWWEVEEPEDLNARAERDTKIKALGFRPTLDYITTTYGEGWEEAPDPPPQLAAPPGAPKPPVAGDAKKALAELFAERGKAPARPRDAADDLAEQLLPLTADPVRAWLDQVRDAIRDAASAEEIAFRIQQLIPALDADQLAAVITSALAVADLTGRVELDEASGGD